MEQEQPLQEHVGSFTVVVNGHHDEEELDQRRPLTSSNTNGNHPNVTATPPSSSSTKFGSRVFSSNLWSRYFHTKTSKGHRGSGASRWRGLNHHARLLMTPATYLDTRRKLEQAASRNLSRDNEWKIVIALILIGILAFHLTGSSSSNTIVGQGNTQQQKLFSSTGANGGSNNNHNNLAIMKNHSISALGGSTQQRSHAPQRPVETIPDIYNNLVDLEPNVALSSSKRQRFGLQVPLFWHVPRSGGTTIKEIMGKCLGLVMASDINSVLTSEEKYSSPYLQTMFIKHHGKYVNVDTTTLEGLKHASDLNLVASTMSQVIVSPLAYEAMQYLFDSKSWTRGLLFTILRDPIERASSLYYYREYQQSVNNTTTNLQQSMELFFTPSPQSKAENNWMTRVLLNKKMGPLYLEDLDLAKEILRRKCLIGLMTHKEASLRRFVTYFGWYNTHWNQPGVSECSEKLLFWGWANKHSFNEEVAPVDISEGTHLYNLIKKHNEFDLELYQYAKELFDQQAQMFSVTGSNNNAATAAATSTAIISHNSASHYSKTTQSPDSSSSSTSIQLPPATIIQKGELPTAATEQPQQPTTPIAASDAATDDTNEQSQEGTSTNTNDPSATGEGGVRR